MGVASDLEAGDFLVAGVGAFLVAEEVLEVEDFLVVEEVSEVGDPLGVVDISAGVDFLVEEEIMEDLMAGAEDPGLLPMEEYKLLNL